LKNLFHFIFKNIHWLLFCVLICLSFLLIANNNQFQRSKYLQATREVTGRIYSVTNYFHSYFYLKNTNAALMQRMAQLETEIYACQSQSASMQNYLEQVDILGIDSLVYSFIPARVANNSVLHHENYLTLNKGSNDGIQPDMGVLSSNGVVGVVVHTSPHFSTAISLLNTKYKLNGKIQNSDYFGPLVWDGRDARYIYLTEIPRHVAINSGDTVVTSGYSTVFPKGIPIGTIVGEKKQRDDSYRTIRIKLFTDFNRLNEVLIVTNRLHKEQKDLEERILNPNTTH